MLAILNEMKGEAIDKKLTLIAAGVAFYGLLALFPGIGAAMAVAGLVIEPETVTSTLDTLSGVMPQAAAEIVVGQAREVASGDSGGLGLVAVLGILVALYSASKGMQALIDGMNIVAERDDERSFVKTTALKLALTFGLIVGLLLCVAVAVAVPVALSWLPLGSSTETLVSVARWPVLLVIAALGLALTYRVGPAGRDLPWRWIVPGAALACVLWLIGTLGFAVYVRMFGSYQETFGALGGVVILLMWLWLSATIVLLGALLARVMDARDAAPEQRGERADAGS
ncbi:YihY/virulence factor BrkB family protein [Palleronia sediminis]|uniref:YihY/virulence factor BrkB family protein n=1 Tax=Palleronia sediminis TaxID=2547833 RepID=A0A4V3BA02_9RHOB|nr:YihY/virulence factor BrkB family protein [Palleronia sediminis]TDL81229.1 YihY/virulence factor BrkB family protein [Palleronia sediminis]